MQGEPEKEKELKAETGTIIVPAFIFSEKKLMFLKQKKVLIGFEQNRQEIEKLIKTLTV